MTTKKAQAKVRAKPTGQPPAASLQAAKQASPSHALLRSARLLNERALARAAAKFGVPIRASHTTLFPHLDLAGTRQTELAKRMGVSKQAVHPLVRELVSFGVLEQVADPKDARATLVRFTKQGTRSLFAGLGVLAEIDKELAARLGAKRYAEFSMCLREVDDWLSREPD